MLVEVRPARVADKPTAASAWEPPIRGRGRAWVAVVAAALAVGVWVAARPALEVVEVLVVGSDGDALVLDAREGTVIATVGGGLPSPDGSVVVASEPAGEAAVVTAIEAATGAELWRRDAPAGQAARLVSMDGETVVLGPDDGDGGIYEPPPRLQTTLTVSRPDGTRSYRLDGNLEPEALSSDGDSLFVISYVPPGDPQRYQVRRLDLDSGAVVDVFTPDEELQQEMGGTARVQAWAPDGSRLYTLYTLDGADGPSAFVHVLALDGLWAHCVDLPDDVAVGVEEAASLAVSPDGDVLYVTDQASRTLVEIDTVRLAVGRTAALGGPSWPRQVASAATPDGGLLIGAGGQVEVRSRDSLVPEQSWRVPGQVFGLRVTADGREAIAVLTNRRVIAVDVVSGERLRTFAVPGDGPLASLGGTAKGVQGPREVLDCAC